MPRLRIPFHTEQTSAYYDRIKDISPVYQKGITDIRTAMESNHLFEERLRKIFRLHAVILKDAQSLESSQSWDEEEVYLGIIYDMFQAMYTAEADRIANASGIPQEKARNLYDLGNTIARLPFSSAAFMATVRPKLQKIISDAAKKSD